MEETCIIHALQDRWKDSHAVRQSVCLGHTAYLSLLVVVALLGLIGSMRDGADSSLFWRGEILKQDLIFDLL